MFRQGRVQNGRLIVCSAATAEMFIASDGYDVSVQRGERFTRFIVSATTWPYAARLDGCTKLQGMSCSMRAFEWPSRMARRVVAR